MARNTRKKNNRVRKRTLKKIRGGNPKPKQNKNFSANEVSKLIKDEFATSFTLAGDVGYSPTAPVEQAKRTLLLREQQKNKKRTEKKSKVSGIKVSKDSGEGLASAISKGYSAGVSAASTVKSRIQQTRDTIGSAIGQKIPTSMSNMKRMGQELFGGPKTTRTGTRTGSRSGTRTGSRTGTGGPPPPPGGISDLIQETGNMPPTPPSLEGISLNKCPVCSNDVTEEVTMEEFMSKFTEFIEQKSDNLQNQDELKKLRKEMDDSISEHRKKINEKFGDKDKEFKDKKEKEDEEKEKERQAKAKKLAKKMKPIKEKCAAIGTITNTEKFEKQMTGLLKNIQNNDNNNEGNTPNNQDEPKPEPGSKKKKKKKKSEINK